MNRIQDLWGKRLVFFDGAMGTMLQENGLPAGAAPEPWNLTHPEIIRNIHRAYLEAGCDVLKTNTFGANPIKLHDCSTEKAVSAGVALAKEAIREIRPAGMGGPGHRSYRPSAQSHGRSGF